MARSRINANTVSVTKDGGAVLFSIVLGEQLEFPVELDFIEDVTQGYTFEAVVIEGLNATGQEEPPTEAKGDGRQDILTIRLPNFTGNWNSLTTYSEEEIVLYDNIYYKQLNLSHNSTTAPSDDAAWAVTTLNTLYVQMPDTLGTNYAQSPKVDVPVYGFFELRVTEPAGGAFQSTWKPVRGMVEILYSPTEIVADV